MVRVLIVDDERDTVESFTLLLKHYGHEIRKAFDGESVVQLALAFNPDVILLDLGLPGIDGYEVARRLRQFQTLSGTKIAAMTGHASKECVEKCMEAGIDIHFAKPLRANVLNEYLNGIGHNGHDGQPDANS